MDGSDFCEVDVSTPTDASVAAETLLDLGLRYCLGRDVPKDYVTAHKWFNLAAVRGCEQARHYRAEISREMSQSEVAEAQRQARLWMTSH
jgi:TPR repeat protein